MGLVLRGLLGVDQFDLPGLDLGQGAAQGGLALDEARRASDDFLDAALDVFAKEPLPADHPFWSMKNVIITPHLGGFNQDSSRATMPALTHNLRCFLAGEFDKMVNRVAH